MKGFLPLLIPFVCVPLGALVCLRLPRKELRNWAFALLNVLGAMAVCLVEGSRGVHFQQATLFLKPAFLVLGAYLAAVVAQFVLVRIAVTRDWLWPVALFYPCSLLVFVKYLPQGVDPLNIVLAPFEKTVPVLFLGISFMAFRLTYLAVEVRNRVVPPPTLAEYLGFAFFVPTLLIGPISRYSLFIKSYYRGERRTPVSAGLVRILVGLTKYLFLSSMINQLGYAGLLLDMHPHTWIDLAIAVPAFYLYLYCNFSGYCDMAIGTAALLGLDIEENFDRPFSARNLQEFWNRWHMTLGTFMRELMFAPVSKALAKWLGPKNTSHAIAITIVGVFVVIGAWHGVGLQFGLLGVCHGFGVAAVHYYTIFLKKRLGKAGYLAYQNNAWIRRASTTVTFVYVACSLFLFANSLHDGGRVFTALGWK